MAVPFMLFCFIILRLCPARAHTVHEVSSTLIKNEGSMHEKKITKILNDTLNRGARTHDSEIKSLMLYRLS